MDSFSAAPPAPTSDLATAKRDLSESGYCVVTDVLKPGELDSLRRRLDENADAENASGKAWFSRGNHRIFMLLNKGEEYLGLVGHETASALNEALLGPDFLLSSITAHVTHPGNAAQSLHTDQQYIPGPWPYAMATQVCWMLDDFTQANGATHVLPGSHVAGRPPVKDEAKAARTVAATGPAGSLLFMDGRLWHRAGVNTTVGTTRRGVFAHYCLPFIRPQENVFRSLRPDVRTGLTPRLRRLLGYDVWEGLGMVDGLPADWMGTGRRSGPTNADGLFPE
ncbi:phytanoyl-CoA dioxygenase family protein [Streptomyces antimycoticus]|uniref:phytanoyl-CoA dioxygenase family protein n=1 Tax=Streptomyces antimycoticus TaxID=68175 RepID=UPI00341AAE16